MNTKYSKKKMVVAGRSLVVNRCLADNCKKTQCKQAALKDHICCQFHYMTCSYESVVDATIIDDVEPQVDEYIVVDFGFRDATAVSIHMINEEKAQQHESRNRWAHMVQSIVNFR